MQFADLFPDVTLTTRSRYEGARVRTEADGSGEEDRYSGAVATAGVGPKCKAANLIRRLTEGSVASGPVASRGPMWHADPRQLYIINSHKYANRGGVAEGAAIATVATRASPTRICASLSELPRKSRRAIMRGT